MRVYLDNAATTPISNEVIAEMTHIMTNLFGNPSSIHADGRKVRATIEQARKSIAKHINASTGEIFFTSGGTESNNMALKCSVRDLGVTRIISSPIEHHCVTHTLESIGKFYGTEIVLLNVDAQGRVDLNELESLLKDNSKKTLVSLMHANNEIGTLNDISRISKLCQEYNALFHTDTVQTVGHFAIDVQETPISFLSGGAHKFHGPKGIGFIYINGKNNINPYIDGGAQERNMRGGTENVYGIVGMAKALDLAYENMEQNIRSIEEVRSYLKSRLTENFEDIEFNGNQDENYLYTILSVSFPPSPKNELLLFNLDIAGISASGGSACSSGADKGSHVLEAIGQAPGRTTIRFSFSHYNTKEEVDFVIDKLKTILPVQSLV